MIGKHLKDYKRAYIKARKDEPRRFRIKRNSDWKKRWLPFIKYDHDFDGGFFLELIVHKLHIMLDYYEHGKYCDQVDESRLEIVTSLKEACRLGDSILNHDFEAKADAIFEAHCVMKTVGNELKFIWDSPKNQADYEYALRVGDELCQQTTRQFFLYLADHYQEWWD